MIQSIEKIIKWYLVSLGGVHNLDKDEAISLLMLLGLKHYSMIYSLDSSGGLELRLLRQLAYKYINDLQFLRKQRNSSEFDESNFRQENSPPFINKIKYNRNPKQQKKKTSSQIRIGKSNNINVIRGRPDSMTHFPFADDIGTVGIILKDKQQCLLNDCFSNFMNMGKPARKRLVLKLFDEMRFDKKGINILDIPEALSRLGIVVPSRLKHLLSQTKNRNSPANSTLYDNIQQIYYEERCKSLYFTYRYL